ncbi:hypothetical protein BURK2_01828 [Burkholderiales bacterium]|nr:hypothetical protein BURK2_01828 [Burkholderiales bacterium]
MTLGSRICTGVSGETSNCSMVPRSFSCTAAAAAGSMMARMVMTVSSSEMGINQASFWFGLYQTRCSSRIMGTFCIERSVTPKRASA